MTDEEDLLITEILGNETHPAQSFRNRSIIEKSVWCGCYYCGMLFPPDEIEEWWDNEETAVCPHCDIDAVVGNAGIGEMNLGVLERLSKYYFTQLPTPRNLTDFTRG